MLVARRIQGAATVGNMQDYFILPCTMHSAPQNVAVLVWGLFRRFVCARFPPREATIFSSRARVLLERLAQVARTTKHEVPAPLQPQALIKGGYFLFVWRVGVGEVGT